jgi:hypothetical protein
MGRVLPTSPRQGCCNIHPVFWVCAYYFVVLTGMLTIHRYSAASRYNLVPRNYLAACYITVRLPIYPRLVFLKFQQLYPISVGSVHIKSGEKDEEGLDITTGYLDE